MVTILVCCLILTCSNSFAQIFISFDGVKGESAIKQLPSFSEINSFSWGAKNSSTIGGGGGGASVGKVQVSELIITKSRGSASPALQMFVFNGKSIPKAEIRCYRSGASAGGLQNPYLTITLENVLITNWAISADGREGPKESFSLVFTKFRTEDTPQKADGSIERIPPVGWDIQRNTAY